MYAIGIFTHTAVQPQFLYQKMYHSNTTGPTRGVDTGKYRVHALVFRKVRVVKILSCLRNVLSIILFSFDYVMSDH